MKRSPRTLLGYCFIFLVAFDWVCASYLVQGLEVRNVPPLLITTVCNSMFLLFLFPHWLHVWCVTIAHGIYTLPEFTTKLHCVPCRMRHKLYVSSLVTAWDDFLPTLLVLPQNRDVLFKITPVAEQKKEDTG